MQTARDIWVLGAGDMAQAHLHALAALGTPCESVLLIGRSPERVRALAASFGVRGLDGGVKALAGLPAPRAAIVAVTVDALADVTRAVIRAGARTVLVEKPAVLSSAALRELADFAARHETRLFIGFNRRFYPSIDAARRIISADGGVLSGTFDFTEIESRVHAGPVHTPATLARWGLVNSLHVIDTFAELVGGLASLRPLRTGALPWHPSGATFAGCGVTRGGALFSYHAAWSGAGRWRIELTTPKNRLVLCPLESLCVQAKDSFDLAPVSLTPAPLDAKPGIAEELAALLAAADRGVLDPRLCPAGNAIDLYRWAEHMLGYDVAAPPRSMSPRPEPACTA